MLKRLVYTGSTLRSRPDAFKTQVARELEQKVWPLFANGRLKSVVNTVLPLAQAGEALRSMESYGTLGVVVIDQF